MRSFILMAIGFAVLVGGFPSQTCLAQTAGGNTRLSSAAYQPDSPVTENRLFRLQTGHYGFAYNCDSEEAKRNHPSICWRRADADQLPKRMGCLDRVRHEVAQVSRRILDGMCDSGCDVCQPKRKQPCGCSKCVAGHDVAESTFVAETPIEPLVEQALLGADPMAAETDPAASLAPSTSRRSGLIRLSRIEPVAGEMLGAEEVLAGGRGALSEEVEYVPPPTARITSVVEVDSAGTQQMGLLERLKKIQSSQPPAAVKPKKL